MTFIGTLKPYQESAVDDMVATKQMLVAYEMGLGKTCMAIAASEKLMDSGDISLPVLVVALSSLKYQWQKEIEKFSNSNAIVIDGNRTKRHEQYELVRNWAFNNIDYVIVNYEAVVNDWDQIKSLPLSAMICDEATAIKSFKAKRSKKIKELSKIIDIKFALTGTPIENGRPEEIFSIMQFVNPKVLGRFDIFDEEYIVRNHFGGVERYKNLPSLNRTLQKATVRKSQNDPDVAPYLPDMCHRPPLIIPLHKKASALYRQICSDLIGELIEAQDLLGGAFSLTAHYGDGSTYAGPADAIRGSIMSKVTALRMLSDHPKLVATSAKKANSLNGGNQYLANILDQTLLSELDTIGSPKLTALSAYVKDHLDTDPEAKVVIFTTYVDMVSLIQDSVPYGSEIYTGKMNAKEKEIAKTNFQTNPNVRVLISSDAGGYGVDLPQANLLINYDLPWSSGSAVQRNSRIRRASSRWPSVVVQDMLSKGTIEERQHEVLLQKSAVANAVIDGKGVNAKGGVDLTVGSLLRFLQNNQP
jgi:SNF2 family DNA or RNA helicase